jgi:hypothetical protein
MDRINFGDDFGVSASARQDPHFEKIGIAEGADLA